MLSLCVYMAFHLTWPKNILGYLSFSSHGFQLINGMMYTELVYSRGIHSGPDHATGV